MTKSFGLQMYDIYIYYSRMFHTLYNTVENCIERVLKIGETTPWTSQNLKFW